MQQPMLLVIKSRSVINLRDLQTTESEYDILVRVLTWLRNSGFSELNLARHGGEEVIIAETNKSKLNMSK